MKNHKDSTWNTLSTGGKTWFFIFLFVPLSTALLIVLCPAGSRDLAFLVALLLLMGLALVVSYFIVKWTIDFGDDGDIWRLEFTFRKVIALFCFENKGDLWLKWARYSKNWRMARAMVAESARCGNVDALYEWGQTCKIEQRDDVAGQAFLGAAGKGHPVAAWEIGEARRLGGYYLSANRAEARKWHEIAARNGYLPSVRILAVALEAGDTLDHDPEAAKRWRNRLQALLEQYESAKENGELQSEPTHNDFEVPQVTKKVHHTDSFFEAVHFVQNCYESFISAVFTSFFKYLAQIFLWTGLLSLLAFVAWMIYKDGLSAIGTVPALVALIPVTVWGLWVFARFFRPDRALHALEKRAVSGEPEAMFKLGMLYRSGSHYIPQDIVLAREWLVRAAEKGHVEAMLFAGQFLAWGYGGSRDRAMAHKWFLRAKHAGIAEADTHLQRMGFEG
ncbi:MAG: hypothetical protein FWG02_10660 [Holophagaceae bacterium]|nr:hypothetical protein [Holophagaceae bacterium]